jgi:hypothetical protein
MRRIEDRPTLAEIGREIDSFEVHLDTGQHQRLYVVRDPARLDELKRRDDVRFNGNGIDRGYLGTIADWAGIVLEIRDGAGNMIAGAQMIDQPMDDADNPVVRNLPVGTHFLEGAFALGPKTQKLLGDKLDQSESPDQPRNSQRFLIKGRKMLSRAAGASRQMVSMAENNVKTRVNLDDAQFEGIGRYRQFFDDRPTDSVRLVAECLLNEDREWKLGDHFRRASTPRDFYLAMREKVPVFIPLVFHASDTYKWAIDALQEAVHANWRMLLNPQRHLPKPDGVDSTQFLYPDEMGIVVAPADPEAGFLTRKIGLDRTPFEERGQLLLS